MTALVPLGLTGLTESKENPASTRRSGAAHTQLRLLRGHNHPPSMTALVPLGLTGLTESKENPASTRRSGYLHAQCRPLRGHNHPPSMTALVPLGLNGLTESKENPASTRRSGYHHAQCRSLRGHNHPPSMTALVPLGRSRFDFVLTCTPPTSSAAAPPQPVNVLIPPQTGRGALSLLIHLKNNVLAHLVTPPLPSDLKPPVD